MIAVIPAAHGANTPDKHLTIGLIAVTDEISSAMARISSRDFSLRSPNHLFTALPMFGGALKVRGSISVGFATAEQNGVEAVGKLLDEGRCRARLLRMNDGLVVWHVAERDPPLCACLPAALPEHAHRLDASLTPGIIHRRNNAGRHCSSRHIRIIAIASPPWPSSSFRRSGRRETCALMKENKAISSLEDHVRRSWHRGAAFNLFQIAAGCPNDYSDDRNRVHWGMSAQTKSTCKVKEWSIPV